MIMPSRLVVLVLLIYGGNFAAAQPQSLCTIDTTAVIFGNYSGSTIRMTANIIINCRNNVIYVIGLNAGTAPGATITNRSMTSGPNSLNYELFSDPAYSQNWGDTPGTGLVTGI